MKKVKFSAEIITEDNVLTLPDLCLLCDVSQEYVGQMVDIGILEPTGTTTTSWRFSILQMLRLQKAQRLQADLDLNLAGVALSLELLDEVNHLQEDLKKLEHHLKLLGQS